MLQHWMLWEINDVNPTAGWEATPGSVSAVVIGDAERERNTLSLEFSSGGWLGTEEEDDENDEDDEDEVKSICGEEAERTAGWPRVEGFVDFDMLIKLSMIQLFGKKG